MRAIACLLAASLFSPTLAAQQRDDPGYDTSVARPLFRRGAGPRVAVDGGHHNFHTIGGRYRVFASVLEADGFRVSQIDEPFSSRSLADVDVLVIANPGTDSVSSWDLPTHSAFGPEEIAAVVAWVRAGGALFVIADHMPAAGAAADLAKPFGARFTNGYTLDPTRELSRGDLFRRSDGRLLDHPITRGRDEGERIDSVFTFTGQAFQTDDGFEVLLRFGPDAYTLLPRRAGRGFDSTTARVSSAGWTHAAVRSFGRGRVALVGEAAMFSAQLAGPNAAPMGMNYPPARQNKQLLLNLMHWLAGRLTP